jgi:L(+)-tartrate dehydratase alpha subunit
MMSKKEQVEQLTNYMANFVDHIGKVLPDDIIKKLDELAEKEDSPLSKTIYKTMNYILKNKLRKTYITLS